MLKLATHGQETLLHKWGHLVSAWKRKGMQQDCSSYRSLLISSHLGKTIHRATRSNQSMIYGNFLQGSQIGGRKPVPVGLGIHHVHASLRRAKQRKASFALIFLNLQEAFYRVLRPFALGGDISDDLLALIASRLRLDEDEDTLHGLHDLLRMPSATEMAGLKPHMQNALKGSAYRHPLLDRRANWLCADSDRNTSRRSLRRCRLRLCSRASWRRWRRRCWPQVYLRVTTAQGYFPRTLRRHSNTILARHGWMIFAFNLQCHWDWTPSRPGMCYPTGCLPSSWRHTQSEQREKWNSLRIQGARITSTTPKVLGPSHSGRIAIVTEGGIQDISVVVPVVCGGHRSTQGHQAPLRCLPWFGHRPGMGRHWPPGNIRFLDTRHLQFIRPWNAWRTSMLHVVHSQGKTDETMTRLGRTGPRPIRSATGLWCFWSLSLREKREILDGHRLLAFSLVCMVLFEQVDGAGVLEHPSEPSDPLSPRIWKLPLMLLLLQLPGFDKVVFAQGLLGADSAKSTTLMTLNFPTFADPAEAHPWACNQCGGAEDTFHRPGS